MKWTKDKPTEPGFYFMRRIIDGKPDIDVADVHYVDEGTGYPDIEGGLWWSGANYHGSAVADRRLTGVEWSGPIPPPDEP